MFKNFQDFRFLLQFKHRSFRRPVLLLLVIALFLAVLGLCCYAGFSLVEASRGYSVVGVHGLLTAVASLIAEHRL